MSHVKDKQPAGADPGVCWGGGGRGSGSLPFWEPKNFIKRLKNTLQVVKCTTIYSTYTVILTLPPFRNPVSAPG